jgi:hypothetical protein
MEEQSPINGRPVKRQATVGPAEPEPAAQQSSVEAG